MLCGTKPQIASKIGCALPACKEEVRGSCTPPSTCLITLPRVHHLCAKGIDCHVSPSTGNCHVPRGLRKLFANATSDVVLFPAYCIVLAFLAFSNGFLAAQAFHAEGCLKRLASADICIVLLLDLFAIQAPSTCLKWPKTALNRNCATKLLCLIVRKNT